MMLMIILEILVCTESVVGLNSIVRIIIHNRISKSGCKTKGKETSKEIENNLKKKIVDINPAKNPREIVEEIEEEIKEE